MMGREKKEFDDPVRNGVGVDMRLVVFTKEDYDFMKKHKLHECRDYDYRFFDTIEVCFPYASSGLRLQNVVAMFPTSGHKSYLTYAIENMHDRDGMTEEDHDRVHHLYFVVRNQMNMMVEQKDVPKGPHTPED